MMEKYYKLNFSDITTRRLDPWHYQPTFVKQLNKILTQDSCYTLNEVIDTIRNIAGGATPLGSNYPETGTVKFYRSGEVKETYLDYDSAVFLSCEDNEKLKRSQLIADDIVLSITGAKFGKSAVVQKYNCPGNISQHSVRFHPNKSRIDPSFLVAYLNSPTGQMVIWKEAYGGTRPAIDYPGIRSLIIPKYNLKIQKYIGDKVRQAEQLRTFVKLQKAKLDKIIFSSELEDALQTENKQSNFISSRNLTNRLDPKYYDSNAMAILKECKKSEKNIQDYIQSVCNGFEERNFVLDGRTYITVTEVSSGRLDTSSAPKISMDLKIPDKGKINANCVLVVRTGSVGTAIKVTNRDKDAVISSHFIKLECANEKIAAVIAIFLNSKYGKILQHKISYGAVQPQIGQDELLSLSLPDYVFDQADNLLLIYTKLEDAIILSKNLINSAKFIVEALIEGQIAEQHIIEAQTALEAGDDSLDKSILSNITDKGINAEGKPLFDDIDKLYELIQENQEAIDQKDNE